MHWPISAISSSSSLAAVFGPTDSPRERLLLADGADAAGHALAARLVAEERRDAHSFQRQVDGLVEGHDDP